jgi:hypothetical protein
MIESQRKVLASLGIAVGVLAVYRARRHLDPRSDARPTPMQQPAEGAEAPVLHADLVPAPKDSHRFRAMIRLLVQLLVVLASAVLSAPYILNDSYVFSYLGVRSDYTGLASTIAMLAAMALAAFISAGRRTTWVARIPAILLLLVQFISLVLNTVDVMEYSPNPVAILEATAFGLCGLGIVLCAVACWLHKWQFTEPFAIGLLAISLGLLCLPGLSISTAPLEYPDGGGAALLFATGPKNQNILMNVTTDPLDCPPSGSP